MAYIAMAYVAMACIAMAYIGMAYIGMAYIAMAYIVIDRLHDAHLPANEVGEADDIHNEATDDDDRYQRLQRTRLIWLTETSHSVYTYLTASSYVTYMDLTYSLQGYTACRGAMAHK